VFKLQPAPHVYDKSRCISALKASIEDFEKVLSIDPARSDISTLLDASKAQLADVNSVHH